MSVLKKGDEVYHPTFGKGIVCIVLNNDNYDVHFPNQKITPVTCSAGMLSFSPWPAPDHERPRSNGWWITQFHGEQTYKVLWVEGVNYRYSHNNDWYAIKNNGLRLVKHLTEEKDLESYFSKD